MPRSTNIAASKPSLLAIHDRDLAPIARRFTAFSTKRRRGASQLSDKRREINVRVEVRLLRLESSSFTRPERLIQTLQRVETLTKLCMIGANDAFEIGVMRDRPAPDA